MMFSQSENIFKSSDFIRIVRVLKIFTKIYKQITMNNLYKLFMLTKKDPSQLKLSQENIIANQGHYDLQPKFSSPSTTVCSICLQTKQNLVCYLQCNHCFCSDCLTQHAIASINDNRQLLCPQSTCKSIFSRDSELLKLIPKEFYIKYQKYQQRKQHFLNPQKFKKPCPKIDCLGLLTKKYNCKQCKKQFCAYCFGEKHVGKCDALLARRYIQIMNFMNCPSCNMIVQKNLGCNHIKCLCGFDFCYVCGQPGSHSMCAKKYQFNQPSTVSFFEKLEMRSVQNPNKFKLFFEPVDKYVEKAENFVYDKNQKKYKKMNTIMGLFIIYPLLLVLIFFHILFFCVLIHMLIIIVCFLILPWRYQSVLGTIICYQNSSKGKRRVIKIILLLLLPLSYLLLVFKDVCMHWFCNFQANCGCFTNVKRQLSGACIIILLPMMISQKIKNNYYWQ